MRKSKTETIGISAANPGDGRGALSDALRLIRSRRVGPTTFHRLVGEHGSARAALEALPRLARDNGMSDYEVCAADAVEAEIAAAARAGAIALIHGQPGYPSALANLPDAPPVLWATGRPHLLDRDAVSIVGARNASSLGLRMARRLAHELGEAGFVIVSGLARGIDGVAHEAALETGTIAVLAGGIDVIYPTEHAALAKSMRECGLLLSEHAPGLQPQARHFPQRNRLVAALGRALIVVEAAAKSGSLITAGQALDLGREVMAVPGHPFDARAAGCNNLIRDGATLVRGARDVRDALETTLALPLTPAEAPPPAPPPKTQQIAEGDVADRLLSNLSPSPIGEDDLIRSLGMPAQKVIATLVRLELAGKITRQPGGMVAST